MAATSNEHVTPNGNTIIVLNWTQFEVFKEPQSNKTAGNDGYQTPSYYLNIYYNLFDAICIGFGPFIIAIIGTVTNIINIIIFYRQGLLTDSCTASFVGLSICDLIICILKIVASALWAPMLVVKNVMMATSLVTQAMVNARGLAIVLSNHTMIFTAITSWITAYIALERLTSVVFPFRVKRIFTPKRTYFVITFIFISTYLIYLPMCTLPRKLIFHDTSNSSAPINYNVVVRSGLISREISSTTILVNDLILRTICFCFIVIFNIIIVLKVNVAKKFRQSTSSIVSGNTTKKSTSDDVKIAEGSTKSEPKGNREMVLTKMMALISVMFLVCYFPTLMFGVGARYFDRLLFSIFDTLAIFFETVNSSFNIFIYNAMSSRFNKDLRTLLGSSK